MLRFSEIIIGPLNQRPVCTGNKRGLCFHILFLCCLLSVCNVFTTPRAGHQSWPLPLVLSLNLKIMLTFRYFQCISTLFSNFRQLYFYFLLTVKIKLIIVLWTNYVKNQCIPVACLAHYRNMKEDDQKLRKAI